MLESLRFSLNYRNRVWKQEVKLKKIERAGQEDEAASQSVMDPGDQHYKHCRPRLETGALMVRDSHLADA